MAKPKKEKKMTLADYKDQFVEIWPTEKNKYHVQGKTKFVHPDVAKQLEKRGLVTLEEPEDWVEATGNSAEEVLADPSLAKEEE